VFKVTLHNTADPVGYDHIRQFNFDRPTSFFEKFADYLLKSNPPYDVAILWAGPTPQSSHRKAEPDKVHA